MNAGELALAKIVAIALVTQTLQVSIAYSGSCRATTRREEKPGISGGPLSGIPEKPNQIQPRTVDECMCRNCKMTSVKSNGRTHDAQPNVIARSPSG